MLDNPVFRLELLCFARPSFKTQRCFETALTDVHSETVGFSGATIQCDLCIRHALGIENDSCQGVVITSARRRSTPINPNAPRPHGSVTIEGEGDGDE